MPGGGVLTLRTRGQGQDRIELQVEDTGTGMTPEVRRRALEPFFTTKEMGKGTGMGLAMVYAAMKAHKGSVDIQSAPGQGTRVILRFPALAPDPPVPGSSRGESSRAGFRIFLVDDDELIRRSIPPVLEQMGHRVEVAASVEEALRALAGGMEVDLLILDHNMPRRTGASAIGDLEALRPGLPILVATGYMDQELASALVDHPQVFLVSKPFTGADVEAAIRKLMAAS
jgi:CheY-like chemotaxis protein